jgi:hypothetical protein
MEPHVLLQNEYLTLWYHPDAKIIHCEIANTPHGSPSRDALTGRTQGLHGNRATKKG